MTFRNVVRVYFVCRFIASQHVVSHFALQIDHAQRHDNMQMSLLSVEEAASLSTRSFELGTCSKLLGPKLQAKKFREKKNYGCQHCFHVTSVTGNSNATTDSKLDTSQPSKPRPLSDGRLFNFNGLRSHVKTK
jgi:hypothetical protein